jgi:hypothetical protein
VYFAEVTNRLEQRLRSGEFDPDFDFDLDPGHRSAVTY